jgi:hypothetical protein
MFEPDPQEGLKATLALAGVALCSAALWAAWILVLVLR